MKAKMIRIGFLRKAYIGVITFFVGAFFALSITEFGFLYADKAAFNQQRLYLNKKAMSCWR
jgi:hypothetical protein